MKKGGPRLRETSSRAIAEKLGVGTGAPTFAKTGIRPPAPLDKNHSTNMLTGRLFVTCVSFKLVSDHEISWRQNLESGEFKYLSGGRGLSQRLHTMSLAARLLSPQSVLLLSTKHLALIGFRVSFSMWLAHLCI